MVRHLCLCVQHQAAAVDAFLRFFGFGVLAFEISESRVERFAAQADSDRAAANRAQNNVVTAGRPLKTMFKISPYAGKDGGNCGF